MGMTDEQNSIGHVYLVGAGPGAGDLITVRGLALLRSCDVVIYDRLAGWELLAETREDCQRIYVGKQAGQHSMKQSEINALLVQWARKGKTVVRLKGGDPFVFGRGGEEAECLLAEQLPFTLVPGITSSIAVPELAGIPVTHRELGRSFHVLTAHTSEREPEQLRAYLKSQIESLKDAEGTFVFLMGLSALETICELMLTAGRSPELPVAVIGNGSRYNERIVRGSLSDIGRLVREQHIASPAVIVAGACAALSLRSGESLPLHGVRIGLTGTKGMTDKLGGLLKRAGAETICLQQLSIRPLPDQDAYFETLDAYTWIAFTSGNGVRLFLEQMKQRQMDLRSLAGIRLAAVGSGTAGELQKYGIFPDFVPEVYTAAAMAEGLAERLDGSDHILLYQAREGNPVLADTLTAAGILVTRVCAYTTEAGPLQGMEELPTLSYLTFASSQGVRAFGKSLQQLPRQSHPWGAATGNEAAAPFAALARQETLRIAAIGSQTAETLTRMGGGSCLIPPVFTVEALAEAIIRDHCGKKEKGWIKG